MTWGRELMSQANGEGRGDRSEQIAIDHARRLVRRADEQRLPVNADELRAARRLLAHVRGRGQ